MINFRFHVVSLVAVLSSLSIGVLLGVSSEIDDATVNRLEQAQKNLAERNETLRERVEELDRQTEQFRSFAQSSRDFLVRETLQESRVIILSFESTDADLLEQIESVFVRAGATIDGSLRLSDRLDLATDARRRQAALALESSSNDAAALTTQLVERMVQALSGAEVGFLSRLIEAGLGDQREIGGVETQPPANLAVPETLMVILGPARDGRTEIEQGFIVPLSGALSAAGVVTAVGESGSSDLELVAPVRQGAHSSLITVDSVDTPMGQSALILGLQAALNGRFGHYGFGEGASTVLPEAAPGT
ncbi:MAG: copper transporter [Actinobacteria bacterium]|nr:copper transporter [Actinomycetota bacterium]